MRGEGGGARRAARRRCLAPCGRGGSRASWGAVRVTPRATRLARSRPRSSGGALHGGVSGERGPGARRAAAKEAQPFSMLSRLITGLGLDDANRSLLFRRDREGARRSVRRLHRDRRADLYERWLYDSDDRHGVVAGIPRRLSGEASQRWRGPGHEKGADDREAHEDMHATSMALRVALSILRRARDAHCRDSPAGATREAHRSATAEQAHGSDGSAYRAHEDVFAGARVAERLADREPRGGLEP